jgi:hypothetical protein
MRPIEILVLSVAFSFLFFGMSCLFAPRMKREFHRYGLSAHRRLTGILQLSGGSGILIGLRYSPILTLAALAGLALLMILGVAVRLRIRDPWPALIPALFYAVLCTYLFFDILKTL